MTRRDSRSRVDLLLLVLLELDTVGFLPFFDHDFCPRDLNVMNLRYHHFEFDLSCVELRNMYSISLSCVKKPQTAKGLKGKDQ